MRRLLVPGSLIAEVRLFFEGAGSRGQEATGMIGGREQDGDGLATRFVAPDQRAGSYPNCWVEVTDKGKRTLAISLAPGELWLARIHSHPGDAFHSSIDERNPGLTSVGSWSIVVPYFGLGLRHGIDACAVYQRRERAWQQLSRAEAADRVIVTSE